LLIYDNGGPPVLNIAQRSAFLCFAIVVSVIHAKEKERERERRTRKMAAIRKKQERRKVISTNRALTL
jgi:hypothetical protein